MTKKRRIKNTSAKGDRLAYKVVQYFVDRNFVVIKGAASKSYPKGSGVDLVAWNKTNAYVIQLKNMHLSENAKQILHESLMKHHNYISMRPLILTEDYKEELESVIR